MQALRALALLLCVFVIVAPNCGSCDPTPAARCEWAECQVPPATTDTWQAAAPDRLPTCSSADKNFCAESCRREFDTRFKQCVDTCMQKRCVAPTPSPTPGGPQQVGSPCVEIESPVCENNCQIESTARRPRCRRDCLQRACPDTNQMDITKESLDPGAFRCDRCQSRFEIICNQNCTFGMIGTFPGIERWGCQKACIMFNCSRTCGSKLAF